MVIRGGIGAVSALLMGGAAQAQNTAPPSLDYLSTLATAFYYVDWDPQTRGTLLIIASERAGLDGVVHMDNGFLAMKPPDTQVAQILAGNSGYSLARIAPRYGCKIAPVGTLSAVVPEMMATLRYKYLPEPDLWANVRLASRIQFLLVTLSPAQWRTLMSPGGIGIGDLKRNQQAIFDAVFPETIEVYRREPSKQGENYTVSKSVPADQINRNALRLRLYQDLQWSYLFQDARRGALSMGDYGEPAPVYSMTFPQRLEMRDSLVPLVADRFTVFGAPLMETQTNRSKPSDLDYGAATLDRVILLDGIATVGDLIARVREKTQVEIYTDPRYAALSVYTRAAPGIGVRAGDVLRAAALSVTGTYRRVEGDDADAAFVLTDDRVGSAVRLAAIADWVNRAEQSLVEQRGETRAAARDANIATNATWALQDEMAPSPALVKRMKAIKEQAPEAQPRYGTPTPVSELPSGAQARVRSQMERWRSDSAGLSSDFPKTLREDVVVLQSQAKLAVVIPGLATIPLQADVSLGGDAVAPFIERSWLDAGMLPPDPATELPLRPGSWRINISVLSVAVKSDADAREAARIAKSHGFAALLLGGESPALVAAAKATAPTLAVWIHTPLFRQPTNDSTPDTLLDRTITGETWRESLPHSAPLKEPPGDFLAVSSPAASEAILQKIAMLLGSAPGVDAVVFTDNTPPGYADTPSENAPAQQLGYTNALRLAFLRETGTDPVDLSLPVRSTGITGVERGSISTPFFPDWDAGSDRTATDAKQSATFAAKKAHLRWQKFRAERLTAARNRLHEAIAAKYPGVMLYRDNSDPKAGLTRWLPEPTAEAATDPPAPTEPLWLTFTYNPRTPSKAPAMPDAERLARQLSAMLTDALLHLNRPREKTAGKIVLPTNTGLLLDLTQAPITDVETLLSQIKLSP